MGPVSKKKINLELQIPDEKDVNHMMLLPLIDFHWHFQSIVSPSAGSGNGSSSTGSSPRGSINSSKDQSPHSPSPRSSGSKHELSEEECLRDEFFRVFQAIDENGDGLISKQEVGKLMAKLGHPMTASDLDLLISTVDINGDGCIDFEEFQALYITGVEGGQIDSGDGVEDDDNNGAASSDGSSSSSSSLPGVLDSAEEEENLRDAFRVFDQNGDGFITPEELHRVLSNLGFVQGARGIAACKSMIRGVDANGDGLVDFGEFKSMMLAPASPRSYIAAMIEAN